MQRRKTEREGKRERDSDSGFYTVDFQFNLTEYMEQVIGFHIAMPSTSIKTLY